MKRLDIIFTDTYHVMQRIKDGANRTMSSAYPNAPADTETRHLYDIQLQIHTPILYLSDMNDLTMMSRDYKNLFNM